MSTSYLWLKAVHVLAVTMWLGGAMSLVTITSLLSRDFDRQKLAAIAEVCDFVGARLVAPAAGTTILAGLINVWNGHVRLDVWVLWGIGSGLLVLAVGATVLRLGFQRLVQLLNDPQPQMAAVADLTKRVRTIGAIVTFLLVVTVVVMVLKPTR